MTAKLPDWVTETPEDPFNDYRLEIWVDTVGAQSIDVTKSEYIALKAHLAAMRGYGTPTLTEALATIMGDEEFTGYNTSDDQQTAMHLETARDFYARFPHLVVMQSDEFDRQLTDAASTQQ